uniref:Uncharacterized protein n=1 Tax=Arundo donax TaxID=35708 RepID=A0A0A8Y5E8_ARUDO
MVGQCVLGSQQTYMKAQLKNRKRKATVGTTIKGCGVGGLLRLLCHFLHHKQHVW